MIKQFLLNADGSIPDGADVSLLEAEGIPFVMPTEQWVPAIGFVLTESDPVKDEHGVWRQVWIEVSAPEPVFEQLEDVQAS
jgi:hypothetical protein